MEIELIVGIASIPVLLILIAIGMPIAFALGLTGVVGLALLKGVGVSFDIMQQLPYHRVANFTLIVVPLFMLMGHLAAEAGISRQIYRLAYNWLGNLPGGLAVASVAGCAIFASVSGSSPGTAVTMGKIAIPEMRKYGYDAKLAAGTVASAGTLGILIPPSIMLCLYGIIAEESIGALLLAGFLPGILTAICLAALIVVRCTITPQIAPRGGKVPWSEKFSSLKQLAIPLLLFLLVIGGIYGGLFTATEAAAVGVTATVILLFITQRKKGFTYLKGAIWESAQTTGMIFALMIGGACFSRFIVFSGVIEVVISLLTGLALPALLLLVLILLLYIPLGMFLDPLSMLLITAPFVLPLVSKYGFSLVWWGILMIKMIEVANITPPLGINVYVIKGIVPDLSLEDVFRGVFWFAITEILVTAILFTWPQISLFLPQTML